MFLSLGCIFEGLCCSYTAGLVRVCVAKTSTQLSLKDPLILPMGSHVHPVVGKANTHKYMLKEEDHQKNIVITTISTVVDTLAAAFKDFRLTPPYRVGRQVTRFQKCGEFFSPSFHRIKDSVCVQQLSGGSSSCSGLYSSSAPVSVSMESRSFVNRGSISCSTEAARIKNC